MNLKRVNDEVYIAEDPIVRFGRAEIAFVKEKALASPRKRARICAHKANGDALHEMLIAVSAESYIHPHRHVARPESFHIVEGEVDVVLLDEQGGIEGIVELGTAASGRGFFYRLPDGFHTLLIRSGLLVVHEVTTGPFSREGTVLAPFAPAEDNAAAASQYMRDLESRARTYASGDTARS